MGQEAAYRPFGGIFHEMAPATRPGPISQTSATDSLPPVGFGALGEAWSFPGPRPLSTRSAVAAPRFSGPKFISHIMQGPLLRRLFNRRQLFNGPQKFAARTAGSKRSS